MAPAIRRLSSPSLGAKDRKDFRYPNRESILAHLTRRPSIIISQYVQKYLSASNVQTLLTNRRVGG
jgi:hypothetical protein